MGTVIDLTGQRLGRLLVIEKYEGKLYDGRTAWRCKCDCGNICLATTKVLRNGDKQSCGCLRREMLTERNYKHGGSVRNQQERLYHIWLDILRRCKNPKRRNYKDYGGRGIKVCEEWENSYLSFRTWALNNGYNDTLTIDRIDNNGNYCPENCRWVTMKEQNNNKRNNHYITYNGETHTVSEWLEITGIKHSTMYQRLRNGWSIEEALTTPVQVKHFSKNA